MALMLTVFLGMTGCGNVGGQKSESVSVGKKLTVDDVELAKIILKPARETVNAARDPFEPLIYRDSGIVSYGSKPDEFVKGIKLLGVTRIDDEYRVLLSAENDKGIYKINDQIKDYTVKKITNDRVILSNGVQIITLRKGDQK